MIKILFVVAAIAILGISAQSDDDGTNTTTTTTTTENPSPPQNITTNPPTTHVPNTTTAAMKNITSTAGPVPVTTTPTPIGPRKSDNGTEPSTGTWMVNRTDGFPCIIAEMAVKFVFNYNMEDQGAIKIEGIEYNLPANASMVNVSDKSVCDDNLQVLVLEFFNGWEFSVYFNKTSSGGTYEINSTNLFFKVDNNTFPNVANSSVTEGNATSDQVVFTWNDKSFLKCQSKIDINGFSTTKNMQAWLTSVSTRNVRLDVFRTDNSTDITASPSYCAADTKVSNIVPIAVGAALAGLVLIVLIAYLIGRSRNQRGYESV